MDGLSSAIIAAGSQAELARRIGASPQQIQEWRNGKRPIPPDRCQAIEDATGVPCEKILPDLEWHTLPDGRKVWTTSAKRKRAA